MAVLVNCFWYLFCNRNDNSWFSSFLARNCCTNYNQTAVFVISSILLIFLTKPFVQKFMNSKDTVVTNAYSIIGKHGLVIEDIDSISGTGQIKVDGEVWSAKCSDSTFIPKGSNIKILKIDGVKAVVTTSTTIESDSEILN